MKKLLFLLIALFSVKQIHAQVTTTISHTDVTCNGQCNGTATVTPTGGTPPYTYNWSPVGITTQTANGLCAGTYSCTVTDALAGSVTTTVTILQPTPISISFGSTTNATCNGACNASATAIVTGGTPAYTYLWSQVNFFTPTASNICAGSYTITVTDANGCVANAPIVITQPAPLSTGISAGGQICTGNNVAFNSNASGGTPGYNFQWTFSGGSPSSSNLSSPVVNFSVAGTYSAILHLTDANNCWVEDTTWVTVSDGPTLISSSAIEAGCNFSNGSATVNVSGISPFMYNWVPSGGVTATETGLSAGTYTANVTDPNGCTSVFTVAVGDSCNFVWPGDANDDAVADNNDILDIGIANGATGTIRANASTNWIGQPSIPWGQTLASGTDYKWVDCNGDGTIDLNDTDAVVLNFGFTHNNRLGGIPVYNATLPDLTVTMNQDSLAANSAGSLSIALGNAAVPASNVYGLAFTLNFDPAQIDASSFGMNETGTWMGTPGSNLMGVVLHQGTGTNSVEVAITRYDHTNANGNGTIANLGFMTTNALNASGTTQNVTFSISNVTVISANENTQQVNAVNDSVIVADPGILNGISVFENTATISAFPNPFDESVVLNLPASANGKSCVITLTDASGRVVLTQQTENAKSVVIHRGELEAGIYFCSVRNGNELIGNTKLIVK